MSAVPAAAAADAADARINCLPLQPSLLHLSPFSLPLFLERVSWECERDRIEGIWGAVSPTDREDKPRHSTPNQSARAGPGGQWQARRRRRRRLVYGVKRNRERSLE